MNTVWHMIVLQGPTMDVTVLVKKYMYVCSSFKGNETQKP